MSTVVDDRPSSRLSTRLEANGNTNWEEGQFEEFYDRALSILRTTVETYYDQRLRQRVDVEDIVQEAMLEVLARFDEFQRRRPMPILIWLRETALQQIRIAYRRHHAAQKRSIVKQVSFELLTIDRLAENIIAIGRTADQRFEETEQAIRIRNALQGLRPGDREILELRYFTGLTNGQAAQMLGVSTSVASKRHCRALARLKQFAL